MKSIVKQPLFWIGFLIIAGILAFSFYHKYVMNNVIPEDQFRYDERELPIDKAPFTPDKINWFGTNQFGTDLFYMMVSGAKYTIGIALGVALARLLLSFFGGLVLSWFKFGGRFITGSVQAFYYLPSVMLVYLIVSPIIMTTGYSLMEKILFEMLIMVLIAVPLLSVLIKEEIGIISQNEFIMSSRLMGAGYLHIFWKHVLPHLKGRLLVVFLQQVISTLNLMAQLGVLSLFVGGTIMREFSEEFKLPVSLSNEWSGLIGGAWYQLNLYPHLVFFPVLGFAVCILAFNFMLEGLRRAMDEPNVVKRRSTADETGTNTSLDTSSFQFLDNKKAV
ncbi:ABC transporter permease [Fictibacillus aquaticus]|nr:ABC transporter permease subunit [Fictibacillus aquaticus]